MTRILVLGGTGWFSARVAEGWVARGADVTCLARGGRLTPAGARLVVADRTAPHAYGEVADHDWDEVIDVSSDPAAVASAVAALGDRTAHATYVSSVSVYASNATRGADEATELSVPLEPDEEYDFSRAKSAAERAVRAFGRSRTIVRPGLIVGPGDPTDRFGYWPARFAAAGDGPVLVPDAPEAAAQVIDVDDLADFVVDAGARAFDGTVNAVGPSMPLGDVLTLVRQVSGYTGTVREAPSEWLLRRGIAHWAGPRSLPLWLPDDLPGFATRDNSAYRTAGGGLRPLVETIERTLADERERGLSRARAAGLERSDELALIAALDAGGD